MVEVGSSRLQNQNLGYALRIFGRPPRTTACDCERTFDPALPQTLYRMTDQGVLQKLNDRNGRLTQMLKSKLSDDEILDELFLACLTRPPTDDERSAFRPLSCRQQTTPGRVPGHALGADQHARVYPESLIDQAHPLQRVGVEAHV